MTMPPVSVTRRALVVRGGWDGHMPVETTDLFIPFLEAHGFEVRVADDTAVYVEADYLAGVDLIVQINTMNTIKPEELTGLQHAVLDGTGMAGWHGGIADSYRNSADYLHMIGGQFAHHAAKDPAERMGDGTDNFIPYTVHITDLGRQHPITEGIDDFDLVTEQYWVLSDEYNDVLATTTQEARSWDAWNRPVTAPAIWTRQWGQGRIFVSAPGHQLDVVQDTNVRTIIERGLLWAAR
jgi:type 1 glutamine amidotransferase